MAADEEAQDLVAVERWLHRELRRIANGRCRPAPHGGLKHGPPKKRRQFPPLWKLLWKRELSDLVEIQHPVENRHRIRAVPVCAYLFR